MKCRPLLLILYLTTWVIAFGIRGGFERMWFWYANRLAVTAAAKGIVVKELVPLSKPAQTNFNDFIRFINGNQNLPDILKTPTLSPPVDATAKLLDDMELTGLYYHELILPTKEKYSVFMDEMGKNILQGKQSFDPTNPADQDLASKLDSALMGVIETRQSDFDSYYIKELERRAKAANIGIKFETFTHTRNGELFPVLDVDKTLRAFSDVAEMDKMRKWLHNEHNVYLTQGSKTVLNRRRNHWDPLQKYKQTLDIQNGAACSNK